MIVVRLSDNRVLTSGRNVRLFFDRGIIDGKTYYGGINDTFCTAYDVVAPQHPERHYFDGTVFTDALSGLALAKTERREAIEALSKEKAEAGVTVNGEPISSDDAAISEITSTLSTMGRKPAESVDFLFQSGWANARKPDLEAMQDAIWMLRKSVGSNRRLHHEAIDALTTTQDVIDYDISTGW